MDIGKIISYEDSNIIICDKPVGVASQSERSFETDLLSGVLTYRTGKGEPAYGAVINRLDKPVGGLVLIAKNKRTASMLSALSGEHSIRKNYYAVAKGVIAGKGEWTDFLLKEPHSNHSVIVKEGIEGARKAGLIYEALEVREIDGCPYTLLRIRLLTGRHHQIRVQAAGHGHPLYGDLKYNPDFADQRGVSPALYAYRLEFNNPAGADKITVETKPKGKIWDFEYFNS